MSTFNAGKIFLKLMGMILFLPVFVFAQEQERVIDKESWRTEPIKIRMLKTKGKAIELGKKFLEEDDWLKGLTARVENISDKPISRIEIKVFFPRPKGTSEDIPTYVISMIYGLEPSADLSDATAQKQAETQKQVLPGDEVDVKLLEVNLPFIKTDLESLDYPEKITHAQISIGPVTFSDGTTWYGDEILYPHPDNPKRKSPKRLPDTYKLPQNQSALPGKESAPRFKNVSFLSLNTPAILNSRKIPSGKFRLLQSEDPTLNCNTVYLTTIDIACQTSGCTREENVFDDDIQLLGIRNARKTLSSGRCVKSDGTACSSARISNFARAPCGAKLACAPAPPLTADCPGGVWECDSFRCDTPVIVDVAGNGLALTNAAEGVSFDFNGDGVKEKLSWTAANSDDAWLALDRNGNGKVDNGRELFGNYTAQPASDKSNGFLALAEFDKAANGGNDDGVIDNGDKIFSSLRLWQDADHDGNSKTSELHTLTELGVAALHLDYKDSKRQDVYGNLLHYRSKVNGIRGTQVARWAWDVFLVKE